jgi:hypothetical protein
MEPLVRVMVEGPDDGEIREVAKMVADVKRERGRPRRPPFLEQVAASPSFVTTPR